MPTPKLNRLAQLFMQRIQDPVTLDGGSPEKFNAGTVIRTVKEIELYLHTAGQIYFDAAWKQAHQTADQPPSVSSKTRFLNIFPELFTSRAIAPSYGADNVSSKNLSSGFNDVHDILDSIHKYPGDNIFLRDKNNKYLKDKNGLYLKVPTTITDIIEVWDQRKLTDCLAESDPFYSPPRITFFKPGMILQQPILYFFPNAIADESNHTYILHFIQNIKNRATGDILRTGGTYDVPYSELHIDNVAEIATGIFNKDDFQEDAG